MKRTDVFIKVEIEGRPGDDARKMADELCRRLMESYGVINAEVSNVVEKDCSSPTRHSLHPPTEGK